MLFAISTTFASSNISTEMVQIHPDILHGRYDRLSDQQQFAVLVNYGKLRCKKDEFFIWWEDPLGNIIISMSKIDYFPTNPVSEKSLWADIVAFWLFPPAWRRDGTV